MKIKARAVAALLDHVDKCPLGWHDGKVINHRSTTEADVLAWLMRLDELARRVRPPPR